MGKDQLIAQAFELIRKRGFNGISTDKLRSLVAEGEKVFKVHPRTEELVNVFRREIMRREAN